MRHVYIAHQLGTGADRPTSLVPAQACLRWVVANHHDVVPHATWMAMGETGTGDFHHEMAANLATVELVDEVWLMGPCVSTGMALEGMLGMLAGAPTYRVHDGSHEPWARSSEWPKWWTLVMRASIRNANGNDSRHSLAYLESLSRHWHELAAEEHGK